MSRMIWKIWIPKIIPNVKVPSHDEDVTNFIQLVSPQLVDQFPQTKLPCKVPNEAIHTYMGCTKVTTND